MEKQKVKINAYVGVVGSGKDYSAKKSGGIQIAFADELREDIWTMLGWRPKNDQEYRDFKDTKVTLPGGKVIKLRQLMLGYGTEIRRKEDPKYWVRRLIRKLYDSYLFIASTRKPVEVMDCRMPNEFKALIELTEYHNDRYEVEFIHCDYKSDSYDTSIEHESERIAQEYAGKTFEPGEFDRIIKARFRD